MALRAWYFMMLALEPPPWSAKTWVFPWENQVVYQKKNGTIDGVSQNKHLKYDMFLFRKYDILSKCRLDCGKLIKQKINMWPSFKQDMLTTISLLQDWEKMLGDVGSTSCHHGTSWKLWKLHYSVRTRVLKVVPRFGSSKASISVSECDLCELDRPHWSFWNDGIIWNHVFHTMRFYEIVTLW